VGLNPGISLSNLRVSKQKRKYQPLSKDNQEPSIIIDMEMRKDECQFLNIYGALAKSSAAQTTDSRAIKFGIVQLDFDDFYRLMQLKIQYQRQSISQ
jgi:hypothetical protein